MKVLCLFEETAEEVKIASELPELLGDVITYKNKNILEVKNRREAILLIKDIKSNKFPGVKLVGSGSVSVSESGDTIYSYRVSMKGKGIYTFLFNSSVSPIEVLVIAPEYLEQTLEEKEVEEIFKNELEPIRNKVKYAFKRAFLREMKLEDSKVTFILSAECFDGRLLVRLSVVYGEEEDIVPEGIEATDSKSIDVIFERELTDLAKHLFSSRKFLGRSVDTMEYSSGNGIKSIKVLFDEEKGDDKRFKTWNRVVYDIEY